jgi:Lyzozyme M1 (1,4-beta-N-acetylmuramidase)
MEFKKGIDVSRWNVISDYDIVSENTNFAIVKATQGRAVSGTGYLFADPKLAEHLTSLTHHGIDCGVYHYLTAATVEEARKEAEFFCSVIDMYKPKIKLWAAVDVEEKLYLPLYDKKLLTEIVIAFCQVIKSHGYKPIVYTNPDFLTNHMNNLHQYDLWLALWRNVNNIPSFEKYPNMKVWQYSGSGTLAGINGMVDLNLGFYDEINEEGKEEMSYDKWREYQIRYESEMKALKPDTWAVESQKWAVENKISDGTFPKLSVTRQEVWTMLKRLYDRIIK